MIKLKYYNDPGHGWIAVKRDLLIKLGIANKISSYSYQKGKTVYCEEDCDASLLLSTLDQNNIKWELERIYTNYTPIRNYLNYQGE